MLLWEKKYPQWTRLPVKSLTRFSCGPGSRYSPLPAAKLVHRCAFRFPAQHKAVYVALGNKNTPNGLAFR